MALADVQAVVHGHSTKTFEKHRKRAGQGLASVHLFGSTCSAVSLTPFQYPAKVLKVEQDCKTLARGRRRCVSR
jgi:hypothetical protein